MYTETTLKRCLQTKTLGWLWAIVSILLTMLHPWARLAHAGTSDNLLANPGFEGHFMQHGPFATALVAAGWTPWWRPQSGADPAWRNRMPEYKAAAPYENRIHAGRNAQQLFTAYGTHLGGIYQTVTGIAPGSTIHFAIWGHAWAGGSDDPYHSQSGGPMHMAIGIDPTGGTSAYSPRVVWSKEQDPLDEWVLFQVEAVAAGSTVTVFTRSAPDYPTKHNDVYWDDASLTVTAPPPTPTATPRTFFVQPVTTPTHTPAAKDRPAARPTMPAPPAAPLTLTPSPTPEYVPTQTAPTATPVHIRPDRSICVTAYEDRNANRRQDDGEHQVAKARLVLSTAQGPARELFTSDTGQPACFGDLATSDPQKSVYYLTVRAPAGYRTPAGDTWQIRLGDKDAHLLIGLRKAHNAVWRPAHTENNPMGDENNPWFLPWLTLPIAGGILLTIGWAMWRQH